MRIYWWLCNNSEIQLWLWKVWSLVVCHKIPFTLQEHVKTTKTDKTRFFFAKKMVPDKEVLLNVPLQSTKFGKKELCVGNIKTIGDVFCPTYRNEKCVYISTNKTTSFYDCKKCKACYHVLNNPFKDQKPAIMLFGGDGTHCLHESRLRKIISIFEEISPPITTKHIRT